MLESPLWVTLSPTFILLLNVTLPVTVPPDNGSFVLSATVMLEEPLNETPLIVLAVVSVSAFG